MKKRIKQVGFCLLLAALVWGGTLIADRQRLNEELIRFHVVANSDSAQDQALKLQVRDAVTESLTQAMADIADVEQAMVYLRENLSSIERIANETLAAAGCADRAVAQLMEEAFDTRYYDTFTLPAGAYEALRITIGDGEGQNWWCVVFPTLCMSATSEDFEDVASAAGFPEGLSETLAGEDGYELRFFFLDALGKLENLLRKG